MYLRLNFASKGYIMIKLLSQFAIIITLLVIWACSSIDTESPFQNINTPTIYDIAYAENCQKKTQGSQIYSEADSSLYFCNGYEWVKMAFIPGSNDISGSWSPCSIEDDSENAIITITCIDGTVAVIRNGLNGIDGTNGIDGLNGESCSVRDSSNTSFHIVACTDGSRVVVREGIDGINGVNGANGSNGANGLNGTDGTDGSDGQDGISCTVIDNNNDSVTIQCTDGSQVTISNGVDGINGTNGVDGTNGLDGTDGVNGTKGADGIDGSSCSAIDNGNGTHTISCTDGTSITLYDGSSCSVTESGNGTYTISCTDGTSVTVSDGTNGINGADGADGVNGVDGISGLDGLDGTSCSVRDSTNTSFHIVECTDGSKVIVRDGINGINGTNGVDGNDGTSCSASDNGNGTYTLNCTDGSTVTISDGANGTNGTNGINGTSLANGNPGGGAGYGGTLVPYYRIEF